ncbi:hypothetical protein [Actinomyces trachealis]|uniref:hypothetical protein n=1 Tax=Actinomyces trachealis TaxID=2763540 RepID=UPI001892A4C8|nr:hypothetical protein [Actinomyces trachealis]
MTLDFGDTGDTCSVMLEHGWTPQAEQTVLQALVIGTIVGAMLLLVVVIVDLAQSIGAKRHQRHCLLPH